MNIGLDVGQVKKLIIGPVLDALPEKYNSTAACNLLAGTMLVESSGIYLQQLGGGPALGIYQMEPATHDDCWTNFLSFPANAEVAGVISAMLAGLPPKLDQLMSNLFYATAMARIKYWRAPDPLPGYNDAIGLANYHKNFYNTAGGATVISQSKLLFQDALSA